MFWKRRSNPSAQLIVLDGEAPQEMGGRAGSNENRYTQQAWKIVLTIKGERYSDKNHS